MLVDGVRKMDSILFARSLSSPSLALLSLLLCFIYGGALLPSTTVFAPFSLFPFSPSTFSAFVLNLWQSHLTEAVSMSSNSSEAVQFEIYV